jgi:hypothetical protein
MPDLLRQRSNAKHFAHKAQGQTGATAMTEGWGGTVPESYDSGSHGSPEGVQTTVATVPKHIADGLADAAARTAEVVEMAGALNLMNGVQLGPVSWLVKMNEALEQTRLALTEYRKSTK